MPCRWVETGSGHGSEDVERQVAGRTEGGGESEPEPDQQIDDLKLICVCVCVFAAAAGWQQLRGPAETSGALGAAGTLAAAARQLEGVAGTRRSRYAEL